MQGVALVSTGATTARHTWRARVADERLVSAVASGLRLQPLVATLLVNRGVRSVEEGELFLRPRVDGLRDPLAMADMAAAAERVARALADGEPILVYGDADVDGLSATALLVHLFRLLGGRPLVFVPNRAYQGYSFTAEGVAHVLATGAKVVVSVDHGISTIEPVAALQAAGVDVVITDHHLPHEHLPPAHAVVNPRRRDCGYPFKGLAGVGVAFKLACAVVKQLAGRGRAPEAVAQRLGESLAWVALGTVSDIMPLVDENRILVARGLAALPKNRAPGLAALCRAAGLDGACRTEDVAFRLAPRLNSAARLGRSDLAVELVTTTDAARAEALAADLEGLNLRRREAERALIDELAPLVGDGAPDGPLVLGSDRWRTGLLGLVAGKLARQLHRPVVLVSGASGEPAKGSLRSVEGFHAKEALASCAALLDGFGGHAMAAGFRIASARVPALRDALSAVWRDERQRTREPPPLEYEGELPLAALTERLVAELELLEPFGAENPRPVLGTLGAEVRLARRMGDGSHLELHLGQGPVERRAVAFGRGDLAERLRPGARADLLFSPKLNRFRGRASVELELLDVRTAG